MLEKLLDIDRKIFFLINGQWHNTFLDVVMPFIRNPFFWAPLYLFLIVFMLLNYKWKGLLWILFFIATFGITDFIGGQFLKEMVIRYRPCNDPVIGPYVRSLVGCHSRHSFPSNHALNHFALGMFMFLTLKRKFGKWMWFAFLWAFLVCYAQIYVGQHYPSDIIYGTLVGLLLGTLTGKIFNRKIQLFGS